MANNRIFYPVHSVAINDFDGGALNFVTGDEVHGLQSMSMTTNFNIEQTNELGTQTIYANVEGIPDIEASFTKVLDGHPTPYLLATQAAVEPTLIARSAVKCNIGAAIFPDTETNASGTPVSIVALSGAFVDSISYNFTTDDNFTEDTTFVSNNKLWYQASIDGVPGCVAAGDGNTLRTDFPDPPITWAAPMPLVDSPQAEAGISRSQHFDFDVPTGALTPDSNGAIDDSDTTVMPCDIAGFTSSGTNEKNASGDYGAHVSSFTASVSLAREDINELGRRGPYFRAATFPVEVTSELQATAGEGDLVSAMQDGIYGTGVGTCGSARTNTKDRTIRVITCDGMRLYLGVRNRLQSVGYTGGDADGGNVVISYTYTNFNDFTVMHSNDPSSSGTNWWNNRAAYLTEAGA
jgi:hypothetical protein